MSQLPAQPGVYKAGTSGIHVGLPGDFISGYPAADSKRMLVPFGTRVLGVHNTVGTVKSGSLTLSADKKTRGDGVGGTEAKTFVNLKWSGDLTCTFRVMRLDNPSVPTGGLGPIPLGGFLTLQVPQTGKVFTAPSTGTVAAVTGLEGKLFTVENADFKFQDGDYAEYVLSLEHCFSLEGKAGVASAEVDGDGLLLTFTEEEYGI